MSTALSSAHTKNALSRFNPGRLLPAAARFAALYFADDPTVAQFEVGAVLGSLTPGGHVPHPRQAFFVTLNVDVTLTDVADLTDVATAQIPLQTTAQELTGDWKGYENRSYLTPVRAPNGIAPTQELGEALFKARVEGFRAISARIPYHQTLTVFPENMRAGSSLKFIDRSGTIVHTIP